MKIENIKAKMRELSLIRLFEMASGSYPDSMKPTERLYFQVAKRLQDIPMKQEIVLQNKTPY